MNEDKKIESTKTKIFTTDYESNISIRKLFIAVGALMLTVSLASGFFYNSSDFSFLCSVPVFVLLILSFCAVAILLYVKLKPSKITDEFCSLIWCCGIIIAIAALFGLNYIPSNIGNPDVYSNNYFLPLFFIAAVSFISSIVFETVSPLIIYYSLTLFICCDYCQSEYAFLNVPLAHLMMLPGIGLTIVRSANKDVLIKKATLILTITFVALAFITPFIMYLATVSVILVVLSVAVILVGIFMKRKGKAEKLQNEYSHNHKVIRIVLASVLVLLQIFFVVYIRSNPQKFRNEECEAEFEIEKIEITDRGLATVYLKEYDEAKNNKYTVFSPFDSVEMNNELCDDDCAVSFTDKVPLYTYEGYVDSKYFNGEPLEYENYYTTITDNGLIGQVYTEKDWESAKAYATVYDGEINYIDVEVTGNKELEEFLFEDEESYWDNLLNY